MIALAVLAAVVGAAVGASIEAARHRCPDPNPALLARLDQAEANARHWRWWAVRWQRSAHRWRTTSRDHEAVLAALGRAVAAGGSVDDAR